MIGLCLYCFGFGLVVVLCFDLVAWFWFVSLWFLLVLFVYVLFGLVVYFVNFVVVMFYFVGLAD